MGRIVIISIFLAVLFAGCQIIERDTRVENIALCDSPEGFSCISDQELFTTDTDEVFVSCALINGKGNCEVIFSWYYLDADTSFIDRAILNTGMVNNEIELQASLTKPGGGWPEGYYMVEINVISEGIAPYKRIFEMR